MPCTGPAFPTACTCRRDRRHARAVAFLEAHPRGGYRTIDLFVGKFKQAKAANDVPEETGGDDMFTRAGVAAE